MNSAGSPPLAPAIRSADPCEDARRNPAELAAIFRQAVEFSPCGMIAVDETGAIVLVNRELENQFGYQRDELIGRSVDVLLPERLRNRHMHQRGNYNRQPAPRRMEVRGDLCGLRKDGREFPVEIALNPIQTSEGSLVLGVIVDISARKEAEARLREKDRRIEPLQRGTGAVRQYRLARSAGAAAHGGELHAASGPALQGQARRRRRRLHRFRRRRRRTHAAPDPRPAGLFQDRPR